MGLRNWAAQDLEAETQVPRQARQSCCRLRLPGHFAVAASAIQGRDSPSAARSPAGLGHQVKEHSDLHVGSRTAQYRASLLRVPDLTARLSGKGSRREQDRRRHLRHPHPPRRHRRHRHLWAPLATVIIISAVPAIRALSRWPRAGRRGHAPLLLGPRSRRRLRRCRVLVTPAVEVREPRQL